MQPNLLLIYPMFAMVVLTFAVGLLSLKNRIAAVKQGLPARYFKTFTDSVPPEAVVKTDRHFVNLFEVPVLFYAGCLVAMILPLTGLLVQVWAWFFVVARIGHAFIHVGSNRLYPRMSAYLFGCAAVIALWVQIILSI